MGYPDMCGIFGIVSTNTIDSVEFSLLADHAKPRGQDSSGLFIPTVLDLKSKGFSFK